MRILFTGLGSIGTRHLSLLRNREEQHEIIAYRSGESDARYDDLTEYQNLEQALEEEPSVAFITNPTHLHVDTAIKCARHGCHLFIEKPLSHSLEGVDRLIELVEDAELVSLMGCPLRFHPVLQKARDELEEGSIGSVRSFEAYSGSYLPEWRPDRDYRETYSARSELGGGVTLDLIHEIDYVYWLFGEVTRQLSMVSKVSDLEIQAEDILELIVETVGGILGHVHLDYYRRTPRRTLEIVGSEGVLEADFLANRVVRHSGGDTTSFEFDVERDDMYRHQLDYFLDHVRAKRPCENDIKEGKAVLEIALQAREGFSPDD